MPIDYTKYPPNWKTEIRPRILERAGNRCEFCKVKNYEIIFRGIYKNIDDYYHNTEVYQDGDANIFDAETGDFIIQDYEADIEPLSGNPDQKAVKVILTIMHLNHDITDNRDENLKAACQLHHLRYDAKEKANKRRKKMDIGELFG